MMKTSLVIMAAGIGSRFGGGIKQLAPVGPTGEIIMDYSVHDAILAGFDKIVFIIRRDIEEDFREVIGDRIEKICKRNGVEVAYAFQSIDSLPSGFSVPEGRTKPWGTGQAVLAAKDVINEPFAVINADDYYGKEAFKIIHEFLASEVKQTEFCMAGYKLCNTLSENGGVTRGVCKVKNGYLTDIKETHNIVKTASGAEADGVEIPPESIVSMNMWGFHPDYLKTLESDFIRFLKGISKGEQKAEYLIPIHIGELLKSEKISVKILNTADKWFGVTYKEDRDSVVEAFKSLIAKGEYKPNLFQDM